MMEVPAVRNAVAIGVAGFVLLLLGRLTRAHLWLPIGLVAAAGLALGLQALHPAFLLESLVHDPPWSAALLLAAWSALGASGMVRARSWWAVVLVAALLGDVLVAAALSLCEPDDRRRARLVMAASGASLVGPFSGATAVALGWGGLPVAALGLVLALVGFARGGERPAFNRELDRKALVGPALVPVWFALVTWLFMLGGVPDFAAMGLENLPIVLPGQGAPWVGAVAAILGGLGAEAGVALLAGDILLHATQLRGDWAETAMRVGIAVGGGLPLLLATRSRVTVGLPLWTAQVLLALGFLAWRY